jgi:hypothetical protein
VQDVVSSQIEQFLRAKRVAGIGKGTLSTVTGDMVMLTGLLFGSWP